MTILIKTVVQLIGSLIAFAAIFVIGIVMFGSRPQMIAEHVALYAVLVGVLLFVFRFQYQLEKMKRLSESKTKELEQQLKNLNDMIISVKIRNSRGKSRARKTKKEPYEETRLVSSP
jgi:uncharacterized membrane protein